VWQSLLQKQSKLIQLIKKRPSSLTLVLWFCLWLKGFEFNLSSYHVGFMVDKVVMRQAFFEYLFYPVSTITPITHSHISLIYHGRYVILAIENIFLPLLYISIIINYAKINVFISLYTRICLVVEWVFMDFSLTPASLFQIVLCYILEHIIFYQHNTVKTCSYTCCTN
jgi:hypothetical protein